MKRLTPLLDRHGGWHHRATLLDHGWKPHQILEARRREGVPLVRRKWLVLPAAPSDVRTAAALGGVITGVSALARYDLWVPPGAARDLRPHIALRTDASGRGECGIVTYRLRPVVERHPRMLVDAIQNVLGAIAWHLPYVEAFAVWESAIRQKHTTPEELAGLRWTSAAARELVTDVSSLSDSGIESTFVANCRRAGIPVVQQVRLGGRRVDALIGRRLVIQLDGYAFHSDAAQRRADIAHDRKLVAMGYTVLRFSYQDVMYDWPRVERDIRAAIARGLAY